MPRGVPKDKQPKPAEVEEVDVRPQVQREDEAEFPPEAEDQRVFDSVTEEFNEHIKTLVRLFVEKEIEGLDERISDLEMVVGSTMEQRAAARPVVEVGEPHYDVPSYQPGGDVEEYSPAHKGGDGTPWYTG